ncbi:M56 family metallopeptidase [Tundrisphaera lichenicola]|uniref:M56 family metallopeptidase n=1 Tax=Tundrisphaera lichenicola TaxID=2029860 RepID=UPI003EBA0DF3
MLTPSSTVWMASGWTMIHLVWVGTLIGLMAAIARLTLRSARPEIRYAVALVALMLLIASPVALFAILYEPPAKIAGPSASVAPSRAVPVIRDAAGPSSRLAGLPSLAEHRGVAAPTRVEALVPYLPWLWMAGSLSTLALLATGLVGVDGLRRSSRPIHEGPIAALVDELAASLGIAQRVAVRVCDRIAAPVLVGIVKPMILLPPAALGGWGLDQVEMVLLHELAHLRRWDNLVNLAQRVVESLLFFHPATWWLSSWVRLERELCCDRLVVDRVGCPRAYAEMLVSLATPGRRLRPAMAMADGPMLTRVRCILNLEDRSMKLSMPEGLGVVGAIALVATLALGSRAETLNELDAKRAMARKAVAQLEALRGPREREASRINALEAFAGVQIKLGDREAGVGTLKRAFEAIEKEEFQDAEKDQDRINSLIDIPRALRAEGETDIARAMLDRMTKLVDDWENKPSEPSRVAPVEGDKNMLMRVEHVSNNLVLAELLGILAQERLELGDRDEALRLLRRTGECLKDEPAGLRATYLGYLAGETYKAGDPAGARDLIDRARKLADGAATPEEKEAARGGVSMALARSGDLDGALVTLATLNPARLKSTLDGLVREMTEYDNRAGWYGPGWLKVSIGADIYKITDLETARRDLPRFAEALSRVDAPVERARTLARVAHLQAKAGDFAGARKTAEAIPAVHCEDFPGPSDGFYDAIRPVAIALIARERAEAGDRSNVEAEFREALDAARAIRDVGEKSVALMVIGRERARLGDKAAALAVLDEVEPLVVKLPEPRRSRSLAMIVSARINAGDLAGAGASAGAIRSYPKSEKLNALRGIAEAHRKVGDIEGYRASLREELAVSEAEVPKDVKLGPTQRLNAISIDTFIDPDLESMPGMEQLEQRDRSITIRGLLDGPEVALKLIRELPDDDPKLVRMGAMTRKHSAYGSLVAMLVQRGDLAQAEGVIEAIPDLDLKLAAMTQMAFMLENAGAK